MNTFNKFMFVGHFSKHTVSVGVFFHCSSLFVFSVSFVTFLDLENISSNV